MQRYNPREIEPKWQKFWEESGTYTADLNSKKPKYIAMSMFNYPSGAGIHIGHAMNYTISDVKARFKRQQGYESYHPVGWDAFGLPAENYAIKSGVSPQESMANIIPGYHKQYKAMGWSNDWEKEISTHLPEYYKWTQWIFSEMYRQGLAYQDVRMQWWCTKCQTVLANEQVVDGKCWRHDSSDDPIVEKREVKQWFFKITEYADELLEAIDSLDWTESVKLAQRNWIGRSKGAEITFRVETSENLPKAESITVFTTRPDTIFGATFMVLAPEHPMVEQLTALEQKQAVESYVQAAQRKTDVERQESKEKSGVFIGAYAINPVNGERIPVWIADYVLLSHGSGAIMAVPAHDERDYEFAKKYNLPVRVVVAPSFNDTAKYGLDAKDRDVVNIILHDPKTDKYCLLDWQENAPRTGAGLQLPGGGIEDGEAVEQAALREVREETGYTDVAITEVLPAAVAIFYKDTYNDGTTQLRRAVKRIVLAELKTDAHNGLADAEEHEKGYYSVVWKNRGEIASIELWDGLKIFFDIAFGNHIYDGEGVMINSGKYDNVLSSEARERIVADLEKRGIAKERVNYRMRDWSVSRQRYWGAPIPIVNCWTCAARETTPKLQLNFRVQEIWEAISDGRKTVESRALNPEEPDRYFGNVTVGDILKLVNKTDAGGEMAVKVAEVRTYKNLRELYEDTEFAVAVKSGRSLSWDEFEASSAKLSPGYVEKVNENGIVAWRISRITVPVLIPDEFLPVLLPELDDFKPSGDGRSALARADDWLKVSCPKCGGQAERETDTLDTYIDSSWYMYRYFDPHNQQKIFDSNVVKKWEPTDFYNGADHATAHLLYARFIARFFKKLGLVNEPEPFKHFLFNGKVTAADGQMFSKSKGNGVDPLEIINEGYGADALRTYLMFASPLELWTRWDPQGVPGAYRFLNRLWNLVAEYLQKDNVKIMEQHQISLRQTTHQMIRKITEDLEADRYNTAIATAMSCLNDLYKLKMKQFGRDTAWQEALEGLVACVAPFAPHVSEELWHQLGHSTSVHVESWPKYDEKYLLSAMATVVVQVNGKLRAQLTVDRNADEAAVIAAASSIDRILPYLVDKSVKKTIYVPHRLVNFVIAD